MKSAKPDRVVDVQRHGLQIVGELRRTRHDVAEQFPGVALQRGEFGVVRADQVGHRLRRGRAGRASGRPASTSRMRVEPSTKTTRLPLGILTVLCSLAMVPTRCRSASVGSSTRGSSCATTPSSFRSPSSEFSSASELSRPTVSGRTPPGNRTVSRTGKNW